MKKLLISCMAICIAMIMLVLGVPVQAEAAETLTDSQKETLYNIGYPKDYKSSIDKMYDDFVDVAISEGFITKKGALSFNLFITFIGNVKATTSTSVNKLGQVSVLTRAIYFEVSDLSNRMDSINGISDCLTNRIISGNSRWGSYYDAASINGLDGLNTAASKKAVYWHSIMKNPLKDALGSGTSSARKALVKAYINSSNMISNELNKKSASKYRRYSSLPTGYLYFSEAKSTNAVKIGAFYFTKKI